MRENLIKSVRPFNMEAAKRGAMIETRDGREARIICFDCLGAQPIVALIKEGDYENSMHFSTKGRYYSTGEETNNDLVMVTEMRECYVYAENHVQAHLFAEAQNKTV